MRTLNNVVLVLVLVSFGFVLGCESDSPTAPSAPSTTMAEAPSSSGGPSVRGVSYRAGDVRTLAPADSDSNAYEFWATHRGGALYLRLDEGEDMRGLREASKPHRQRDIRVWHCPSEPHHVLQTCGDSILMERRQLAGELWLTPIVLPECSGWIVVIADELSDDVQDGWRNAVCPPRNMSTGSNGRVINALDPPEIIPAPDPDPPSVDPDPDPDPPVNPGVPAWFNAAFNDELVYNHFQDPRVPSSRVFNSTAFNVRISKISIEGSCQRAVVSDSWLRAIAADTRGIVQQVTGRAHSGSIDVRDGILPYGGRLVLVGFTTSEHSASDSGGLPDLITLAEATVGSLPGAIYFHLDRVSCQPLIEGLGIFRAAYAHEFGHVLGFFHVSPARYPGSLMAPIYDGMTRSYSPMEQEHTRNAYRLGRGYVRTGRWPGVLPGVTQPERIEPEPGPIWVIN